MTLTRYSNRPRGMWNMMEDLMDVRNALDSYFERGGGDGSETYTPLLNAFGSSDETIVEVELPGVDPKDAEIAVVEDVLTLKAKRTLPELSETQSWHRQERPAGEFVRNVKLPYKVDVGKVSASFKNGILRVTLPRTEAEKPKRIEIKVG